MLPPIPLSSFEFEKQTLPNGLDVVVRRQANLPLVAMNLWYHVGSKNEERTQRGYAHLFEHLMFEGSAHYPGDFFKPLQRVGAGINGSTSSDRTNYYVDIPTAHLELALAMESDRMGHLIPALTDEKLRIQKDVVKNEYRQNYANRPYGQAWQILSEALYPPQHPYSWLTIGVMEDLEQATREDVAAFFRRFYVPGNASLALVGDVDPERAFMLAEKYFGSIAGGARALPIWAPAPDASRDVRLTVRDRVELDRLYDVWHTVPQFHADDAALVLLADVLGRGRSSRLYRALVRREQLAQWISVQQSGRELAGTLTVVVALRPGASWQRAAEIVEAEIGELAREGPREGELERVLNGRLSQFVFALDNIGGFGGVADRLNAYNIYRGDPGLITSDAARFQAVTPEDLSRVAGQYLAGRPRTRLVVLARKPSAVAPALDRSTPPTPGPAVAFRAPLPVERTLPGGTTLWVLPRRDLPIVAGTALVRAGSGAHPPDRGGLAHLTAAMLDEGTHRHSAEEFAVAVERLGASLSTHGGFDGSYVAFQCLAPHRRAILELAADALLRPSFPEPEWQRIRGQALAALAAERDSAEARANRAFLEALYGPAHPYGVPIDGSENTVAGLTRDDLIGFHTSYYNAPGSAWVIAGDVDPDAVAGELQECLDAGAERTPSGSAPAPPAPAAPGMRLILLDRPGAAQAVVRLGQVGLPRVHPDYVPLTVFNHVLGGQFSSRLNEVLREQKGYTYGIRSHFEFRRHAGPFAISSSLQADRLADALTDLRREVEDLLDSRPPTEAEIEDARRSLIEGQARHFETPSDLVSRYSSLLIHELPPDEHARLPGRLEGVTARSALDAARRWLDPRRFVVIVVADASKALDQLEGLGWAEVEQRVD